MDFLVDPSVLAGLAALIMLEVVLGIDNLVFIAILADKLPAHQRDKARLIGLSLALIMRLGLLASIAWIIGLTDPVFEILGKSFSWRDIILIGGGLFLLAKATKEIHERLEGDLAHGTAGAGQAAFGIVIAQIIALDAVFSIDSIITAVGMVDELWVMMVAVVVAMLIMIVASKPLTRFVGKHPTVIILCLSFLLIIGCSLIAEGFGFHIPKGYIYTAMGFSILIELFNQLSNRNRQRALDAVPMRQRAAEGIYRLLAPKPGENQADQAQDGTEVRDEDAPFQPSEQAMIRGVIELADQPVQDLMTARPDIFWLDTQVDAPTNRDRLIASGRSRVLLCNGSLDTLLGMVEAKTVLPPLIRGEVVDLAALAKKPVTVPDSITALGLADRFRETGEHFAVVVNPAGKIEGVVSSTDIFAAIAGDLADDDSSDALRSQ